ncbi:hypothetical protein M231_07517 [Tremella mesenterica]|uniref:Uncharacterized protein n=1 Tax=Tremella mesenterica TaxID=5217 RepID=A0A4Q1BC17_TREME|nr:hypothetical protein M231_07517 [Tremella mesenterica]
MSSSATPSPTTPKDFISESSCPGDMNQTNSHGQHKWIVRPENRFGIIWDVALCRWCGTVLTQSKR